jgi:hypothetical protein
MFSGPLGRGRFFLFSIVIELFELAAVAVCVPATMGWHGLLVSKPGPGRETLFLAVLAIAAVTFVARCNITWRRGVDSERGKIFIVSYLFFSLAFAALQALTLLTHDFNAGGSPAHLNLLGLALLGMWFNIGWARSTAGPFDPDAFLARKGVAGSAPAEAAAPPRLSAASARPARTGFGRRGLA